MTQNTRKAPIPEMNYMKMKLMWWVTALLMLKWMDVTATLNLYTSSLPSSVSVASGQRSTEPSIQQMSIRHSGHILHILHSSDRNFHDDHWEASLDAALHTLVTWELSQCSLVVAADPHYLASQPLCTLASLPNEKQVVGVAGGWEAAGRRVVWKTRGCRAYIFLMQQPQALLSFADTESSAWDYSGRYVLVGFTRDDLDALTLTLKGRKTEHIIGLVQSEIAGEWEMYINQLYWGRGMRLHATWKNGRVSSPTSPFVDKISDIRGAVLKVAMFEWQPSTLYHRNEEGDLEFLYGRDVEVIRALASALNFTAKFVETTGDEKWGYPLPDGSWTGMVGMLGRDDADLAISNLFVSSLEGRDEYQGYTTFFDTDYSCFIIRTEAPQPRWRSPGLPYTLPTWMAILCSLFVIGFILYIVASAAIESPDEDKETVNLRSFPAALLFTVSLHLQEPYPALPRRQATRIMVAFLLLYTIILAKAYSCNLTAFLTVARPTTGIDTIKELYESQLPLFENTNYVKASLVQSPNIYLRGLAERHQVVKDLHEIMKLVRKGKGVAVVNRSTKEFNINTQLHPSEGAHETRMMKECFTVYTVAVGIQSYSPLKYHFDKAISKIFESGLVPYWKQDSYTQFKKDKKRILGRQEYTEDDGVGGTKLVPLSFDHLQSAFYVLLSSMILSTVIFLTEVFQNSM